MLRGKKLAGTGFVQAPIGSGRERIGRGEIERRKRSWFSTHRLSFKVPHGSISYKSKLGADWVYIWNYSWELRHVWGWMWLVGAGLSNRQRFCWMWVFNILSLVKDTEVQKWASLENVKSLLAMLLNSHKCLNHEHCLSHTSEVLHFFFPNRWQTSRNPIPKKVMLLINIRRYKRTNFLNSWMIYGWEVFFNPHCKLKWRG